LQEAEAALVIVERRRDDPMLRPRRPLGATSSGSTHPCGGGSWTRSIASSPIRALLTSASSAQASGGCVSGSGESASASTKSDA
jgi:hypothetical protein